MIADFQRQSTSVTCQEIIRWTSIGTLMFGFLVVSVDLYGALKFPELVSVWYPGMCLGVLLMCSGLCGTFATYQLISLDYRHGFISNTFLAFSGLSIVFSCAMLIGSAIFFPLILDDRTDNLQALKNTTITFYVLSFGLSAAETVFALRCVYAQQFERMLESEIVEISPLVIPKTEPFLLATGIYENEEETVFPVQGIRSKCEKVPDVQTYLCRNEPEQLDNEETNTNIVDLDVT
ncbi:uncharacterized protein LOC129587300 isoform X2 [Paramacrobiotus metropolitanus]|nr:uncharacterized protein LOC129587300 isoform X2 [Paramacrobiotus metropolitanus]